MQWSYGVMTVITRLETYLPKTLSSLSNAGFDKPRLFVDECTHTNGILYQERFGLEVTARFPAVRTCGNWWLSMLELYLRHPNADRFALFQDDFVICKNTRQYLERLPLPIRYKGYLNLYTFPQNQDECPKDTQGKDIIGVYSSNQRGLGAVALVFDREAVMNIVSSSHMAARVQDPHRGWRAVDGGIVTGMNKVGFREYVHNPSLVQHIGEVSSIRNKKHPKSSSFPGEAFDALELLALVQKEELPNGKIPTIPKPNRPTMIGGKYVSSSR